MNVLLYGSIVLTAFSKPWRAMPCNFLDILLLTGMLATCQRTVSTAVLFVSFYVQLFVEYLKMEQTHFLGVYESMPSLAFFAIVFQP